MNKDLHNCVECLKKESKIHLEAYWGSWSVIDSHLGFVMLEHNSLGDETCYLVVKASDFVWKELKLKDGSKVVRPYFERICNVFETYDDIVTCLEDEGQKMSQEEAIQYLKRVLFKWQAFCKSHKRFIQAIEIVIESLKTKCELNISEVAE